MTMIITWVRMLVSGCNDHDIAGYGAGVCYVAYVNCVDCSFVVTAADTNAADDSNVADGMTDADVADIDDGDVMYAVDSFGDCDCEYVHYIVDGYTACYVLYA